MHITVSVFLKKIVQILIKKKPKAEWSRNPFRDWKTILMCFTIASIVFAAADAYIFYMVTTGRMFAADIPASNPVEAIKKVDLIAVTDYFANRERMLSELRLNKPTLIDPSL